MLVDFSERKKRKARSSSASIKDPLVIDSIEPLPALLDSACDALETPTAVSEIIQETEVEVRPAKRAYHRKVPSAASIAAAASLSEVPVIETPLIREVEPLLGNLRVDLYYIGTILVIIACIFLFGCHSPFRATSDCSLGSRTSQNCYFQSRS